MKSVNSDKTAQNRDRQGGEDQKREFSSRLGILLGEKGWSQKKLSEITGLRTSKISEYVRGNVMPNAESAILIAEALEVRPNWLVLGHGAPQEAGQIQMQAMGMGYKVPLLDTKLAAGAGADPLENRIGEVVIPDQVMEQLRRTSTKGLYVMQAEGDSMEPTVADGSYVLIDTDARKLTEAIFAFRYGETLRLKRLRRFGLADIELLSDNPMYSREEIVGPDKEFFEVIGRAIWAGSPL
jgi:phage repressor protein C with HTH and peptisase S24 domain